MRTRVLDYDWDQPLAPIWGLEGYSHVWLIIRRHEYPLGIVRLALQPWQTTLSPTRLWQAISEQLPPSVLAVEAQDNVACTSVDQCPPISVIVCTRDRPRALQRCLEALSQLRYLLYEVIVVDNAPSDERTANIVGATAFRYVREDRPGLDWARNRGISAARHNLIAYVDDDAQVDPGWLQAVSEGFMDPEVMALTGLVLPLELETEAQHWFETYGGMGKGMQARHFHRRSMHAHDLMSAHAVGVGANMAYRRDVFDRVGLFDTALDVGTPAGGAGDLDMFHRVLIGGLTVHYEPKAIVWHQHRRDMAGLQTQIGNNGRSFGVYLLKVWRSGAIPRSEVMGFAMWHWVARWLIVRLIKRLLGLHQFPIALVWAELWGAFHAPGAYLAAYRQDRRVRLQHGRGQ